METTLGAAAAPRTQHVPVDGSDWKLSMGLRALNHRDWVEIDEDFVPYLLEKRRLIAERHGDVFQALPGTAAAGTQVVKMLVAHLVDRYPDLYAATPHGLRIGPLNEVVPWEDPDIHPLDLAGRMVMEDWCLMVPPGWTAEGVARETGAGGYRLVAASLCFPSRWRLAEKIGKPMQAIHTPVAHYETRLAQPVDRFFDKLAADRSVWRLNWSLMDDPTLFQSGGHSRAEEASSVTDANAGERVWLRVERQTLRRLPPLVAGLPGNILFGIRIHQRPLGEAARDPVLRAGLLTQLRTMDAETWSYKSLAVFGEAAVRWLERQ